MLKLWPLALALLLMGQECEGSPPYPGNEYCAGNDYSVFAALKYDWEHGSLLGSHNTILGGNPSDDRRATVHVKFGSSYCTGAVLGPHLVLTAAHCGYAETTQHQVYVPIPTGEDAVNMAGPYAVDRHLVHPDYWDWVRNGDLEARKSDLMLLYMEDTLPGPYLGLEAYTSNYKLACKGLFAQGLGRWEGNALSLREGKYVITSETDKYLHSYKAPETKICFGDSGGPLYAQAGDRYLLAGITTTTMSSDCLTGGTHVNVAHYLPWIEANVPPPL